MQIRKLLLYLTVFLIPLFAVSPWQRLWGVPVGMIYAGVVAVTIILYGGQWLSDLKTLVRDGISLVPLGAYLLFVLISVLMVGITGTWQSQHLVKTAYLIFSFGVFWLFAFGVEDRATLKGLLWTYLAAGVIACLYGLYVTIGFMLGWDTGQIFGWTVPRLYGTATEAQVFANYLLSIIPLTLGLLLLNFKSRNPWAILGVFTIACLCLVMTFSAGAWAGALVGAVPLLLLARSWTKRSVLTVLLGLLLCWSSLVAIDHWIYPEYDKGFDSILVKFTGQVAPTDQQLTPADVAMNQLSIEERQWFRQAAWNMFKAHPVMGVGYGNYGYLYNQYRPADTPKFDIYVRAHNQYLEILAELGLVGITLMGLVVLQIIKLTWRVLSQGQPKEQQIIYISMLGSLVAVSAQGMTLGIFLHNYFWFVLGLTYSAARLSLMDKAYLRGR